MSGFNQQSNFDSQTSGGGGGGGTVTGTGTTGTIPKWISSTALGDSALTQSGTTVTASNIFNATQGYFGASGGPSGTFAFLAHAGTNQNIFVDSSTNVRIGAVNDANSAPVLLRIFGDGIKFISNNSSKINQYMADDIFSIPSSGAYFWSRSTASLVASMRETRSSGATARLHTSPEELRYFSIGSAKR